MGRDGRRKHTPGRGHSWSQGHDGRFWRGVAYWQHRGLCVGVGWRWAVGDEAEGQEELWRPRQGASLCPLGRRCPMSSGYQTAAEWKAGGSLRGSSAGDPDATAQPVWAGALSFLCTEKGVPGLAGYSSLPMPIPQRRETEAAQTLLSPRLPSQQLLPRVGCHEAGEWVKSGSP